MRPRRPRIGTAGWSISSAYAGAFPRSGSGLERYAARFDCVEINSTFYRRHLPATFVRWAEAVPDAFRFAVKLPRAITHDRRLIAAERHLDDFFADVDGLGHKLGPVLVQLPPSLPFDDEVAARFLHALRERFQGSVVCEPRHASWFRSEATALLRAHRMGRVAADPEPVRGVGAAHPGGDVSLAYFRLHGAPLMYHSPYDRERLAAVATLLSARSASPAWCIFDNTASGAALNDALALMEIVTAMQEAG